MNYFYIPKVYRERTLTASFPFLFLMDNTLVFCILFAMENIWSLNIVLLFLLFINRQNNKKYEQLKRGPTLSLLLADDLVWSKHSNKLWSKNRLGLHKRFLDVAGMWEFHIDCACALKGLIFYKNKIEINYPYPYEAHYEQDWFSKIHVSWDCSVWMEVYFMKIIIILIFIHNQLEMLQNSAGARCYNKTMGTDGARYQASSRD